MIEEEKEKLDRLMGKVQNSYHSIKTNNKQTKLAYVDSVAKPPRGVKRAQVQCHNSKGSLFLKKNCTFLHNFFFVGEKWNFYSCWFELG